MRVLMRADASPRIGFGHVMRCLTLARQLREAGCVVVFACRAEPGNALEIITRQGFQVYSMQVAADTRDDIEQSLSWRDDIQALWQALPAEERFAWCVVDHYGLAADWQRAVRERVQRVMVIDDLANRPHDADVLLDQGLTRSAADYAPLVPAACRLLIGARFSLLREGFQGAPIAIAEQVQRVVVSFGGVDAGRESFKAIEALQAFAGLTVEVIAGAANPAFDELAERLAEQPNWHLHRHVDDVENLLRSADLCIGAGGVSSWERAALGLPSLCIALAANQCAGSQAFAEAGAHLYLGEAAQVSVEYLRSSISLLLNNDGLRRSLAARSVALTDGRGANRVACELLASTLTLRVATLDDARLLFEGRNAEQVRAVSVNQAPLLWEDHLRWLQAALASSDRLLLIAQAVVGDIGVVRYDREGVTAEVSIYLFAQRFALGWGRYLLQAGERAVHEYWPELQQIDASVQPDNPASLALFRGAGYQQSPCRFHRSLSRDSQ